MSGGDSPQTPADGAAARTAVHARRRAEDPLLLERVAETAFLATEFGLDHQAELIFDCFMRLKPDTPSPRIGLAMVQARRGRAPCAIEQMRRVVEDHPESELARAVLGGMLMEVGKGGGREMLDEIIARGSDAGAISVAAGCIEHAQSQQARTSSGEQSALEFHRHHNIRA